MDAAVLERKAAQMLVKTGGKKTGTKAEGRTGKRNAARAALEERHAAGALIPSVVNGEACFVGTVQFAKPAHFRELLNPLVRVCDGQGNRFHVRGLLGHVIAVESAKKQQPAGVVCVQRAEREFDVVRWF